MLASPILVESNGAACVGPDSVCSTVVPSCSINLHLIRKSQCLRHEIKQSKIKEIQRPLPLFYFFIKQ